MSNNYKGYLFLLKELNHTLMALTEVAQHKVAAVQQDNLTELDICIKKEQALSLSLRGSDQKRTTMLAALGLEGSKLSTLSKYYHPELQSEAKKTAEDLLKQYHLYRSAAEVARSTLECNLHQIEKFLVQSDPLFSSGYKKQSDSPEPPAPMKTDFRA